MQLILKSLMFAALFAGITLALTKENTDEIHVPAVAPVVVADYKAIELPEDGQKYYTSLFMPVDYKEREQCRAIVAWFETEPRLRALKETTHFAIYTEDSAFYKERYASAVGYTPAVCVNDASGKTLYFAHEFPKNSQEFASEIATAVNSYSADPYRIKLTAVDSEIMPLASGWRKDRRRQGSWCPDNRNGCPFPAPPKVEPPKQEVLPPTKPTIVETHKKSRGLSVLWATLAASIGAAMAVASEYKKEKKAHES